jgi:hypothetical protein
MNAVQKSLSFLPLILLAGCLGPALRHASTDYSEVYADSVNRQLLLNLARLSQNEPPYFIQIGTISSAFSFTASGALTPGVARTMHPGGAPAAVAQNGITLGSSLSAGATESPTYQFVPLNGEAFAQVLSAPISDKLFYTLYDQGFDADMLARIMIESIAVYAPGNAKNCEVYVNNPLNPNYRGFLAICDTMHEAQLHHQLVVERVQSHPTPTIYQDVKLSDAVAAAKEGFTVVNGPDAHSYSVTAPPSATGFRLSLVSDTVTSKGEMGNANQGLGIFANGAWTRSQSNNQMASGGDKAVPAPQPRVQLRMRTLISAMYAVAREEGYFKALARQKPKPRYAMDFASDAEGLYAIGKDDYADSMGVRFPSGDAEKLVRPILTMTGFKPDSTHRLSKLVEVRHENRTYVIGDMEAGQPNREVFSLLSYLFVEASLDPQKLPVQQLIQVQ